MVSRISEPGDALRRELPSLLKSDPLGSLLRISGGAGDIARFEWEGCPVYLINHPALIQDALLKQQKNFVRSGGPERLARLLGNGLLRSQGTLHQRQRRLVQPALNPGAMSAYSDIISRLVEAHLDSVPTEKAIDWHRELIGLTLTIVGECFFSTDLGDDTGRLGDLVSNCIRNLAPGDSAFGEWRRKRKFGKSVKRIDSILLEQIRRKRDSSAPSNDLLSILIRSRDTEADDGQMDDSQLRDELVTLFIAGHETTASALSWCFYLLAREPFWQERLRESEAPAPLARAVFAEALRLYPPAWILFRRSLDACDIGGHAIPRDAHLAISPYVLGRDPRYFPEPMRFDPARWGLEEKGIRQNEAFLPFGMGNRKCPGEHFAWIEAVAILGRSARRFQWTLASEIDVSEEPAFTLRPRGGLPLVFRKM